MVCGNILDDVAESTGERGAEKLSYIIID